MIENTVFLPRDYCRCRPRCWCTAAPPRAAGREVDLGAGTEARVLVVDPATARPYFFAGSLEGALDRLPERHRLTVHPVDAWRFEVHVTWSE